MQKMNLKAKPATADVIDLRTTLEWLKSQGDLIETDKAVDPDLEITGLQKHMDGGCPVLFNNVKGKPHHRVVTNLFGDIKVINKMFGWKDDAERVKKLAYALRHPLKVAEIEQSAAPCQEHVIERPNDVNEHVVAIRHTTYEPELSVGGTSDVRDARPLLLRREATRCSFFKVATQADVVGPAPRRARPTGRH